MGARLTWADATRSWQLTVEFCEPPGNLLPRRWFSAADVVFHTWLNWDFFLRSVDFLHRPRSLERLARCLRCDRFWCAVAPGWCTVPPAPERL